MGTCICIGVREWFATCLESCSYHMKVQMDNGRFAFGHMHPAICVVWNNCESHCVEFAWSTLEPSLCLCKRFRKVSEAPICAYEGFVCANVHSTYRNTYRLLHWSTGIKLDWKKICICLFMVAYVFMYLPASGPHNMHARTYPQLCARIYYAPAILQF